ncbi:MAG: EF-hand domain-containing protein [Deltaproteobacteria bacterium]|nr:EF-hand domain-containing protein [Deltaproteobacteria bacterium]
MANLKRPETQFGFEASLAALALAVAAVLASGCGKVKVREEKVVTVRSAETTSVDQSFQDAAEVWKLYAQGDGGINRDGLGNLANALKRNLETALGISNLPVDAALDAAMQLNPMLAKGVTPRDIVESVHNNLPMLRWFATELTPEQLAVKLAEFFPESSETARRALLDALVKFDLAWAGGNQNGLLSNKELAFPILIMSALMKLDYSKGLPFEIEGVVIEKLSKQQIEAKFEQQIYGRYPVASQHELSPTDRELETLRLSMRFYQMKRLLKTIGTDGELYPSQYAGAVGAATSVTVEGDDEALSSLARFYDHRLMGGNQDGSLSLLEAFQMTSDLEFARVYNALNPEGAPVKLANLPSIFPAVGREMFESLPPVRAKKSKTVSGLERTAMIGKLRALELVFELYDVDQDGKISKSETRPILQKIGIDQPYAVEAFFADVGLESGGGFWTGVRMKLKSAVTADALSPREFYVRMNKVFTRLLKAK